MKSYKNWIIAIFAMLFSMLALVAAAVIYIDPWFHFHGPVDGISYFLDQGNERYQNDGIVSHFKYNALLTGTSMTENTRVSEINELFGVECIKVPFAGATYKETCRIVDKALATDNDIKLVIRCLDYTNILLDKDSMRYQSYPEYLYDDQIFNDVNYIFNKRVIGFMLNDVLLSLQGAASTSLDDYARDANPGLYSKEKVDASYVRAEKADKYLELSEDDKVIIKENVQQNIINQIEAHPDVEFYYFIPPYSIYYWDDQNQNGTIYQQIDAEKYMLQLLVGYDNVHLFSFNNMYDKTCDLNNYKDKIHYTYEFNTWIMKQMAEGEHRLTADNYEKYIEEERNFYTNYDYDSLFN